ncbi:MAG: RNA polymerase subunit sigma-70 [Monoglobaceae bacterium]
MGFNYAAEKKKFDAQWERNAEWYRPEGMSEEAIQKMKEFDWAVFCSERVYRNHTQDMPEEISNAVSDSSRSSLFTKYPNLSVSFSIEDFKGKYTWMESITDPKLAAKIKTLSKDYIEILTMLIEGYSQTEIAKMRHQHRSAICNKIARIKKLLK